MSTYKASYGKSYALTVAVDEYFHMNRLLTAVYGANAFSELLNTTFGFQTTTLFNAQATERDIIDWCRGLQCQPDDRVIFYFAGHGMTRKSNSAESGYLALATSVSEQYQTALWTGTIVHELESLNAKHVLLILDACFSGLVL